ncbi:hypothetical protein SELMODRAFT_422950 [Selaginella moellendorffii]|uniref:Uncharacterized protein n=1 Tax=Selaginella moellendorffii TaxID=88036 RepID=D8SK30_SELML|nr:hypothetical protein SELMODRAFT_422950 [Selaginella moellendorffii]
MAPHSARAIAMVYVKDKYLAVRKCTPLSKSWKSLLTSWFRTSLPSKHGWRRSSLRSTSPQVNIVALGRGLEDGGPIKSPSRALRPPFSVERLHGDEFSGLGNTLHKLLDYYDRNISRNRHPSRQCCTKKPRNLTFLDLCPFKPLKRELIQNLSNSKHFGFKRKALCCEELVALIVTNLGRRDLARYCSVSKLWNQCCRWQLAHGRGLGLLIAPASYCEGLVLIESGGVWDKMHLSRESARKFEFGTEKKVVERRGKTLMYGLKVFDQEEELREGRGFDTPRLYELLVDEGKVVELPTRLDAANILSPELAEVVSDDYDLFWITGDRDVFEYSVVDSFFNKLRDIEKLHPAINCSVVYGSLPPETRTKQAERFNKADEDFSILVASDAIGMGLNLNIQHHLHEAGQVRWHRSLLPQCHASEANCRPNWKIQVQISCCRSFPTFDQIGLYCSFYPNFPFSAILEKFIATVTVLCLQSRMLDDIPLPMDSRFLFCTCPVDKDNGIIMGALLEFARNYAVNRNVPLKRLLTPATMRVPSTQKDLAELDSLHKVLDMYIWLSYRVEDAFVDRDRTETPVQRSALIEQALSCRAGRLPSVN